MNMKKLQKTSSAVLVAAGLSLAGAAQAQNVIVRVPDNAAELRANMEASIKAAAEGRSVGMITGTENPQAARRGDGAVGVELDASTMMYSVARIHADGSIEHVCVSGLDTAQRVLQVPTFAKHMTPKRSADKEKFDVK
jgi:hypothetical protein